MNAINLISQDLFDKVRSRYSNLEMGDEDGNVTSDPQAARFFDFDFTMEGNNLGRVSISINERGALKVFYGQGILEGSDPLTQELWFDFLREMRMFAKRRLLRFDTRDITKSNLDKNDFQYLAQTGSKEDTMSESKMFGSSKSSYLPLEKTRLIIRHNKAVDEEQRGARSRNINSVYIENAEGERFKYPFIHLAGAKAMQRHVANGGRPYDECGQAIITMSEQIAQLNAFKRHVGRHDSMHDEANQIMERACMKLEALRHQINCLGKQSHYESWKESFVPEDGGEVGNIDPATMEDYKHKFTVSTFQEDLTQYFPLLYRIMKETGEVNLDEYVKETQDEEYCDACDHVKSKCVCDDEKEVKEFAEFASWADAIVEGKLADDVIADLKELLASDLTLGVDAVSAVEALQGIGINDKDLNSALEQLARVNPEGDPKPTITAWVTKNDPDAAQELGLSNKDAGANTAPEMEPAPGVADEDVVEPQEETQQETTLLDIAEMVKSFYDRETKKFPLGKTGVVTKVRKELGDSAATLAERLVDHLEAGSEEQEDESRGHTIIANKLKDIEREKKFAAGELKIPTPQERQAQLNQEKPKQPESLEFEEILRLSGLK